MDEEAWWSRRHQLNRGPGLPGAASRWASGSSTCQLSAGFSALHLGTALQGETRRDWGQKSWHGCDEEARSELFSAFTGSEQTTAN